MTDNFATDEIDLMQWQPVPMLEGQAAVDIKERLKNIRANCSSPVKTIDRVLPQNHRRAIIVCYGPSLKQTWEKIVDDALTGVVVSTSGAHDFLLERHIIPHFHVEFDPREERARFSDKPHDMTTYLIASRCHPSVRTKLRRNRLLLWHALCGEKEQREVEKYDHKDNGVFIPGGACVGIRAITVMHTLGFRDFSIHGFDCSFEPENEWAGVHPGSRKTDFVNVRSNGRIFTTSPVYTIYARQFIEMTRRLNDSSFHLHGDGLLQTMFGLYLDRLTANQEAA